MTLFRNGQRGFQEVFSKRFAGCFATGCAIPRNGLHPKYGEEVRLEYLSAFLFRKTGR